jgi:hypothetical protein
MFHFLLRDINGIINEPEDMKNIPFNFVKAVMTPTVEC